MEKSNRIDRIVILGASGFIGKALLQFYEKQGVCEVHGFSSSALNLLKSDHLWKLKDLTGDRTALIIASAITREKGDTFGVFQENVTMAANVVKFLETYRIGKCVYYSSIAVYGDPQTNLSINEETPVRPETYYALAKYAGEFILEEASRRINFPLLILRASRVYGPGDTHATYGPTRFIQSIMKEKKVTLFGEGEELRDHLYIADLVSLTDRLIQSPASGIFNLVTGKSHRFSELIQILQEVLPVDFKIVHKERRKPLIHQQFDIGRLSEEVPRLRFTDIRWGLKETLEAFVAEGMGKERSIQCPS